MVMKRSLLAWNGGGIQKRISVIFATSDGFGNKTQAWSQGSPKSPDCFAAASGFGAEAAVSSACGEESVEAAVHVPVSKSALSSGQGRERIAKDMDVRCACADGFGCADFSAARAGCPGRHRGSDVRVWPTARDECGIQHGLDMRSRVRVKCRPRHSARPARRIPTSRRSITAPDYGHKLECEFDMAKNGERGKGNEDQEVA
jgi:hypothetical protein